MEKAKTEHTEHTENAETEKNNACEKDTDNARGSFFKGDERRKLDRRKDQQDLSDKLDDIAGKVSEKDSELEKVQKEIESLRDLMQRRQADFENYKKRSIKQFEDQKKFIIKDFAQDVISANDELLRAIEAAATIPEGSTAEKSHFSFVEGVTMISKMIEEALKKYGVTEIAALDEVFNPNFHEAVEIQPSTEVEVDKVVKVYQKGFCIDDLIVRSSKVKVAKAVKEKSDDNQNNDDTVEAKENCEST